MVQASEWFGSGLGLAALLGGVNTFRRAARLALLGAFVSAITLLFARSIGFCGSKRPDPPVCRNREQGALTERIRRGVKLGRMTYRSAPRLTVCITPDESYDSNRYRARAVDEI